MSDFSEPEFIRSTETIDLRHRILRPAQNISVCNYAEDNLSTTFHLGIRHSETSIIISNGTFMVQTHKLFPLAKITYRLRGMATDKSLQRQGLGQKLIRFAEVELQKRRCDLLWFNARLSAENFYQKLSFNAYPEIFDIESVGPHKVMYKWL